MGNRLFFLKHSAKVSDTISPAILVLARCVVGLLLISLSSCNGNKNGNIDDFNKEVYKPEYASGFAIKCADGKESLILDVNNPWQGADSITAKLFIAREGESVPEGFDGQTLDGDAKRIVAMSSTHIAMLEAIGAVNNIVGVSGIDYITNPYIQANRETIGDVGYEGNINYERLVSLDPDLVLLYGVTGASPMEDKLQELGISYMYVGDYLEESPLGKAEWLVALSELVGRRADGENAFAGIVRHYKALKSLVQNAESNNLEGGNTSQPAPKVMLNTPYGDSWFMPSTESYMAKLIADAGGEYIYTKNTGTSSLPIDLEEAYKLTSEADIWINVGTVTTLDELKAQCPKFADTRCFTSGNVYNNNLRATPTGGNDFYESAIVNPDLLLRDLIKIFHPGLVSDDFVYYRHLN